MNPKNDSKRYLYDTSSLNFIRNDFTFILYFILIDQSNNFYKTNYLFCKYCNDFIQSNHFDNHKVNK